MEKFHNELKSLKRDILEMGDFALGMLIESMDAFKNLDMQFAEEVHSKKDKIMELETILEQRTLELMLKYQPMAKDLRTLACIFTALVHITRIGRYSKDIANILLKELKDKQQHMKKLITLSSMIENVESMIRDVLTAFDTKDLRILEGFSERDDIVDEQRMEIFRECLTYMMEDSKNIPFCIAYIMVARYLERCGDHACRIAEKIHYMVEGRIIEVR
ncbi:MAG: phosphate signaling complex protein PhoU [Candidatus Lokiarchaeota archaeon]|nr:phosphate signaling complex protein PhoU [Candidatus Lokiarchaeota archaeon]